MSARYTDDARRAVELADASDRHDTPALGLPSREPSLPPGSISISVGGNQSAHATATARPPLPPREGVPDALIDESPSGRVTLGTRAGVRLVLAIVSSSALTLSGIAAKDGYQSKADAADLAVTSEKIDGLSLQVGALATTLDRIAHRQEEVMRTQAELRAWQQSHAAWHVTEAASIPRKKFIPRR